MKQFRLLLVVCFCASFALACSSGSGSGGGGGTGGASSGGASSGGASSGGGGSGGGGNVCQTACDATSGVCTGTVAACISGCEQGYAFLPNCKAQLDAVNLCAANRPASDFTCDANNQPQLKQGVCPAEVAAVKSCMTGG